MNLLDLPSDIIYYIIMNFLVIPDREDVITNTLYNLFLTNSYFRILVNDSIEKVKHFYTPIYVETKCGKNKIIKTYELPNGNIHGNYKYFVGDNLRREGVCKNGKEVGYWKTYHKNTTILQSEGYYIDGKAVGLYRLYYLTGELKIEKYFDNNEIVQNLETIYWKDGKIKRKNNYKDNLKSGKNKNYFGNGILQSTCMYKNNKLDGPYIEYYSSGVIYIKGCYNDGKKVGIWNTYSCSKKLILTEFWNNGHIISRTNC